MTVPPLILHLAVERPGRRALRLWLPLFLLWPVVLVLGALAFAGTLVADAVLLLCGRRYHRYTVLLAHSFATLCETRGMVVHIRSESAAVDMTVR